MSRILSVIFSVFAADVDFVAWVEENPWGKWQPTILFIYFLLPAMIFPLPPLQPLDCHHFLFSEVSPSCCNLTACCRFMCFSPLGVSLWTLSSVILTWAGRSCCWRNNSHPSRLAVNSPSHLHLALLRGSTGSGDPTALQVYEGRSNWFQLVVFFSFFSSLVVINALILVLITSHATMSS